MILIVIALFVKTDDHVSMNSTFAHNDDDDDDDNDDDDNDDDNDDDRT